MPQTDSLLLLIGLRIRMDETRQPQPLKFGGMVTQEGIAEVGLVLYGGYKSNELRRLPMFDVQGN